MVQGIKKPLSGKLTVGVTGIFGSGKTTVTHMFQELGASSIEADLLAHEALIPGSPVFEPIASLFPEAVQEGEGGLDRKKIAGIIFRDPAMRQRLEKLVHPYVFDRIVEEIHQSEGEIVIVDVPLLFETGFDAFCDRTVVVTAEEEQIKRRLQEKGLSEEEITLRQKAQMPLHEKIKRANWIVGNSGTFHQTREQVKQIWDSLKSTLKGAL